MKHVGQKQDRFEQFLSLWAKIVLLLFNVFLTFYPLSLSFLAVKFETCQQKEEVSFESSDPKFSIGPDGSLYTEQDVTNLTEPIQFMVTARDSVSKYIWETTVKLALAGHPPSPHINQARTNNV